MALASNLEIHGVSRLLKVLRYATTTHWYPRSEGSMAVVDEPQGPKLHVENRVDGPEVTYLRMT